MPNTFSDPYANSGAGGQAQTYKPKQAANASEQVLGLYQSNFGRSASSPEVDTWIKNATQGAGSAYLNNDQLSYIQSEFQKAPEYAQYQGQRPTMQAGQYIPGVTLGSTLADDPALRQRIEQGPPLVQAGAAQPGAQISTPLPGTTSGATALANTGRAEDETTTAGLQSMLRDRLINLMEAPNPSIQDPNLAPAMSAFSAAQNKSTSRQVRQNAESFGAAGLESSGARNAADSAAFEAQGLNEATFGSGLVLQELQAQRQQVQQGLQMALAVNDQDLSRRLQDQLAQLNATVQRESLTQQGTLGQADIDLRNRLGTGNLNLGLLGLAQQGRQFNDSLGWDMSKYEATLNNDALIRLLYGG